jgi:hypothetical protein
MCRVDASRRGVEEGRVGVALVAIDLVGDSEQPEEPIDAAVGGEREVDEAEDALARVGQSGGGLVARADEGGEHVIASMEASAEQLLGDGDALALVPRERTMPSR